MPLFALVLPIFTSMVADDNKANIDLSTNGFRSLTADQEEGGHGCPTQKRSAERKSFGILANRSIQTFYLSHLSLLFLAFLLIGCAKSKDAPATLAPIAELETPTTLANNIPLSTSTAIPTVTPSQTASPTITPTPSHTPTSTHIPTPTLASTPTPTPLPTRLGGGTGRIVFVHTGVISQSIDIINADGTERIQLITSSERSHRFNDRGCILQFNSVWSPDGTRLLFVTSPNIEQGFDIGVSNADGSGQSMIVANTGADDNWPSWSPDGDQILFASRIKGGQRAWTIYMMNTDGSFLEPLAAEGLGSVWSPDGERIALSSPRNGRPQIYVINRNGSEQRLLTDAVFHSEMPTWFPNGQGLAFYGSYEGGLAIHVIDMDGEPKRITNSISPLSPNYLFWYRSLAVSPDGQRILFTSPMDGNWNVYVINVDGSDLTQLTDDLLNDTGAKWSPDGQLIAFERTKGNRYVPGGVQSETDIFVMKADGSQQINLTPDSELWDSCPSWQPPLETSSEP